MVQVKLVKIKANQPTLRLTEGYFLTRIVCCVKRLAREKARFVV